MHHNHDMNFGRGIRESARRKLAFGSRSLSADERLACLEERLEKLDAACGRHAEKWLPLVRLYAKSGGDVNVCFFDGCRSLLHAAARGGSAEAVRFLLAAGADVNARDAEGRTPLCYAGDAETAEALVAAGADAHVRDADGATPLHHVRNEGMAAFLLKAGVDANARDNDGRTPLHGVCSSKIAAFLLKAGADANAHDNGGATPLHYALKVKIAALLVAARADVHAQDAEGRTPLHYARNAKIAEFLLRAGADVDARDHAGRSPLHDARNAEVDFFLMKAGADAHVQGNRRRDIWQYENDAEKTAFGTVAFLMDAGAVSEEEEDPHKSLLRDVPNAEKIVDLLTRAEPDRSLRFDMVAALFGFWLTVLEHRRG